MPDSVFDDMEAAFRSREARAVALEEIVAEVSDEAKTDPWSYSTQAIVNAMRARGIAVRNGMMFSLDEPEGFNPVKTDFDEFKQAAKRVIDEADYPVDAADLVARTGINTEAIPYATMRGHLRQVGIHFIAGLGYWRASQYTDPTGRIIASTEHNQRVATMFSLFETEGWPLAGPDAERLTSGAVTSRFMTRYASGSGRGSLACIGVGMFIPADCATAKGIPMSPNVATALLELAPETVLDNQDHLRLFRLATILERRGYATVRRSRSTRNNIRVQTARVEINDAGRRMLQKIAKRGRDEF